MSACDKVFSITELAEAIFLELSISELLCSVQRTCRHWKGVVDQSMRLQQALYFKPISSPSKRRLADHSPERCATCERDARPDTVVEHPLLTKIGTGGTSLARLFEPNLDAVLRPEASWRKCLATQPPVAEVCTYTNDEIVGYRRIGNGAGVQLGLLMPDEHSIRSLHASHIYAWVRWRKFSLSHGYYQLKKQIQAEEKTELRRLGLG